MNWSNTDMRVFVCVYASISFKLQINLLIIAFWRFGGERFL